MIPRFQPTGSSPAGGPWRCNLISAIKQWERSFLLLPRPCFLPNKRALPSSCLACTSCLFAVEFPFRPSTVRMKERRRVTKRNHDGTLHSRPAGRPENRDAAFRPWFPHAFRPDSAVHPKETYAESLPLLKRRQHAFPDETIPTMLPRLPFHHRAGDGDILDPVPSERFRGGCL